MSYQISNKPGTYPDCPHISGICGVTRDRESDPWMVRCYYPNGKLHTYTKRHDFKDAIHALVSLQAKYHPNSTHHIAAYCFYVDTFGEQP